MFLDLVLTFSFLIIVITPTVLAFRPDRAKNAARNRNRPPVLPQRKPIVIEHYPAYFEAPTDWPTRAAKASQLPTRPIQPQPFMAQASMRSEQVALLQTIHH